MVLSVVISTLSLHQPSQRLQQPLLRCADSPLRCQRNLLLAGLAGAAAGYLQRSVAGLYWWHSITWLRMPTASIWWSPRLLPPQNSL